MTIVAVCKVKRLRWFMGRFIPVVFFILFNHKKTAL